MIGTPLKKLLLSPEEFSKVKGIIDPLLALGATSDNPQFAILMGGVGSGKTTTRKKDYSDGYVQFDYGEIQIAVQNFFGEDNINISGFTSLACLLLLNEAISQKKNMVIEVIGDDKYPLEPVIDGMIALGYKVTMKFVECDPVEAYKRHLKDVADDMDYISAYYTQGPTLSFFYDRFKSNSVVC